MSESESETEQPQCRVLERTLVYCPLCRKGPIQLKTLQYAHKCGKSFDKETRVKEAVAMATARVKQHEPAQPVGGKLAHFKIGQATQT